jgi:MFS family permease
MVRTCSPEKVLMAAQAATGPAPRKFGALRHRDFTLLWVGLLLSNSGTWMQNVAQGWLAYALTRSPFDLGLLGASFAVPMILLPLVGGTIADRVDRLTILKFTQTAMLGAAMAMATLALLRVITIWDMIAISFLSSVALAVDNPTRQALIPDLVPSSELLSAISLNSVAFNGAALVGPALAGLILGSTATPSVGPALFRNTSLVFYLNAASFLAVLGPVFIIRAPPPRPTAKDRGFNNAVFDGLRYVQQRPALLLLLSLSAVVAVFGRSFTQLLPVFASAVLHVGSAGYGLMLALPGAGTLLAGFLLAGGGHYLNRRWLILGSQVAVVGSIVVFALSSSFPLSLAMLAINGFAATVFGAVAATILQLESEGHLRGRVMSLYTVTVIGLGPLGALISGSLATVIPIGPAVVLPALLILGFLVFAIRRPAWQAVR